MKNWPIPVFLSLSGLLLLAIGGGILLAPQAFHASNGIVLDSDATLMSEIRAPGGLLLASALFILVGAWRPSQRSSAVALSVLVYGSYGIARVVGMALDGMPSSGIVVAAAIELVVAGLGIGILWRRSVVLAKDPVSGLDAATVAH